MACIQGESASEGRAFDIAFPTGDGAAGPIGGFREVIARLDRIEKMLARGGRAEERIAEVAHRRLARLEREADEQHEKEQHKEEGFVEAITKRWLIDKGFGFAETPEGQMVFMHSSAIRGADLAKIGSRVQMRVVPDRSREDEGLKATEVWTEQAWRDREARRRAAKAAEQARRAAILAADLATRSEERVQSVLDSPPGLVGSYFEGIAKKKEGTPVDISGMDTRGA